MQPKLYEIKLNINSSSYNACFIILGDYTNIKDLYEPTKVPCFQCKIAIFGGSLLFYLLQYGKNIKADLWVKALF